MKARIFIGLLSFLATETISATPSVSGIDGAFNHGSTLTITGNLFSTRPSFSGSSHGIPASLNVAWKDFEDSTLVSDGFTVENNQTASWVLEDVDGKTNSLKHGKRIYSTEYSIDSTRVSGLTKTQHGTTGNYFFSFWERFAGFGDLGSINGGKSFRLFANNSQNPGTHNIYTSNIDNESTASIFSECVGCSPTPTQPFKAGANKLGEWQRIDVVLTESSNQVILYRNMQKFYCMASDTSTFTNCVWPYQQQWIYPPFGGDGYTFVFGHMIDGPPQTQEPGGYYKFDDLYADYSLAHVEVCSKSTWSGLIAGGGTSDNQCEIQIPTSWSNTAVGINFNAGSFTSGTTVYAYVITANSTPESFDVNANGFALVVGETGGGGAEGGGEEESGGGTPTQPSGQGILIGYDATP